MHNESKDPDIEAPDVPLHRHIGSFVLFSTLAGASFGYVAETMDNLRIQEVGPVCVTAALGSLMALGSVLSWDDINQKLDDRRTQKQRNH
jgi:hypothetical protein